VGLTGTAAGSAAALAIFSSLPSQIRVSRNAASNDISAMITMAK
jgi:hypothetical protein